MGIFKDRIGPAFYDLGCRRVEPEFGPQRAALLAEARGRVLEIGAGTGLNLQHYPPEVEEIRVIDVDGVDKQADAGTHVASTRQIGEVRIVKVENKGRGFRRVRISLAV